MIKRIFILAAAVLMSFSCTGCVAVNFSSVQTVMGKGNMTTLNYPASDFNTINIADASEVELYYTAAPSETVTVEIQENLAELLDVSVNDGVLLIKTSKRFKTDSNKRPKLRISAETLEGIIVDGALDIKESDTIKADSLNLDISGAVTGPLSLEANNLYVNISGAADLTLSGSAKSLTVDSSGAATVKALELQTEQASIGVNGAGEVSVSCSETLEINAAGVGSVNYRGDPKIVQNASGMVRIKRVD